MARWLWAIPAMVALSASWAGIAQAEPEPIRLGFLTVNTGALAAGGRQMDKASVSSSRNAATRSPAARSS